MTAKRDEDLLEKVRACFFYDVIPTMNRIFELIKAERAEVEAEAEKQIAEKNSYIDELLLDIGMFQQELGALKEMAERMAQGLECLKPKTFSWRYCERIIHQILAPYREKYPKSPPPGDTK